MEGVDEEFTEGPPCLAAISKIAGQDNFDGKDRFMYNYHVMVKMKYPDNWQQKGYECTSKIFCRRTCKCMGSKIFKSKSKILEQKF